jgi:acyl carrier protein
MTERVQEIVSDVLLREVPVEAPRDWDSMQNLNIVVALEQEFELIFEPEDFEQMLSVQHIVELIARKQG